MRNAPRIWLDYRPVRIGWVIGEHNVSQLAAAASYNSCLWGGRFNPLIPIADADLAAALVKLFKVDVLVPVEASEATSAFIEAHPHLRWTFGGSSIFRGRECEFVDVRHAVKRAVRNGVFPKAPLVQPVWAATDPLGPLCALMFGRYPDPTEIGINYQRGIRSAAELVDWVIEENEPLATDLQEAITPLSLSVLDLSGRRPRGWLEPGIVLGDVTNFEDLLLFWNLQAAGASVCFYEPARAGRMKLFADAFLSAHRSHSSEEEGRVNFWSRAADWPSVSWSTDLDVTDLRPTLCRAADAGPWNSLNILPVEPRFSNWHRDVVPSYSEEEDAATASFAVPDRPCDDDDPNALNQYFVVTIDANQFGPSLDDRTFATPFVPRLNEFYGRNFHFEYDKARSAPGRFGRGAVGIISSVSTQQLQIHAIRVHDWMRAFFGLFGIQVERSEPGRRCSRLIRQLGGLWGCRVLKVRGARDLISEYGPDQNFTRGAAEKRIGHYDSLSKRMRFTEFEDVYMQGKKLTPGTVLQFLTARGVFRVGLEFACPNCELSSWIHLDEIGTLSTCVYCGHRFDVTAQLKDRDWRYRRSGLFGRDDDQLGSIPVALAIQQLDTALHDRLLMYATGLEFKSATAPIEKCEADFVAVVVGPAAGRDEWPVQILFGEAKSHREFDANDVRKLGKLADAVPLELAETFVMFAKTDSFTGSETRLAQALNTTYRRRVILWSQDELEPYHPYERAEHWLGQRQYATTLNDMAGVTEALWFPIL